MASGREWSVMSNAYVFDCASLTRIGESHATDLATAYNHLHTSPHPPPSKWCYTHNSALENIILLATGVRTRKPPSVHPPMCVSNTNALAREPANKLDAQ